MIKVNVLSSGRFHVLDLARELDKNGFDVKFFSFVPTWRSEKFGLPKRCSFSLFWCLFPFVIFERKIHWKHNCFASIRKKLQDRLTALLIRKADVTIAMSGGFCKSIEKAKQNGSFIIVERGSKHILEQKRILESIPSNSQNRTIDRLKVKRELHDYEIADIVSIATEHVKRSFLIHNYPSNKLFVNPYGVDVSRFTPSQEAEKQFDLIMVGTWCYRKGCDLIIRAIEETGLRFLHVGNIGDMDFPQAKQFTHIDAVDETALNKYYHKAKIFILPSREEGLALVQVQALACNLPIIGSPDSGAEDLKTMVTQPEYINIIKGYKVEFVVGAIKETMETYNKLGASIYAGDAIKNLSWEAYGVRYSTFLYQRLN